MKHLSQQTYEKSESSRSHVAETSNNRQQSREIPMLEKLGYSSIHPRARALCLFPASLLCPSAGNGHASERENDANQSSADGGEGDIGGAESAVSNDDESRSEDDAEEHEEVEDATGDHATGGDEVGRGDDIRGGRRDRDVDDDDVEDEDEDEDVRDDDDAPDGRYTSEDGVPDEGGSGSGEEGEARDREGGEDGSPGWMSSDEA